MHANSKAFPEVDGSRGPEQPQPQQSNMTLTQDQALEQHKAEALQDLQDLLHPAADTCEAALRELANKWWAVFQERGNNYANFRYYAGTIYRHLLQYIAKHVNPDEGGNESRQNFCKFRTVLMRNVPRNYWDMFFLEWHGFQTAYLKAELESDPDGDAAAPEKTVEALLDFQKALSDYE